MKTLRHVAYVAAVCAYLLIVLGAVVRITGSGLGCGDDWPLCNGRLIPRLDDYRTVLEWGHRLVAAALAVLTFLVGALAWMRRSEPGASGPGGPVRPALLAVGLLVLQVFLGAVTVWLELPASAVVLHLGTAMALIAALLFTALRTGQGPALDGDLPRRALIGTAAFGAVVILFGGLTANMGAGPACQGFPLCSGQLWPTAGESGLPHIHWTHRLVAYALFLHLIGLGFRLRKRNSPAPLQRAVWVACAVAVVQVGVAAVMVLASLPPFWRVLHLAVGTALWVALVYAVWLVRARPAAPASG